MNTWRSTIVKSVVFVLVAAAVYIGYELIPPPVVQPSTHISEAPAVTGTSTPAQSAEIPAELFLPRPFAASDFVALPLKTPGEACGALLGAVENTPGYHANIVEESESRCLADVTIDDLPADYFVVVDASGEGVVKLVRIKLNVTDPAAADAAFDELAQVLESVGRCAGFDPHPDILSVIRGTRQFEYDRGGATYRLRREFNSDNRYNLFVRWPVPDFARDPRRLVAR